MTATAEETTTVNPYASDVPGGVDLSKHSDDTVSRLWAKVKAEEPKVWALHADLQKFSPPTQVEIDKIIEESDSPDVVALREKIEQAEKVLASARETARGYIREGIETLPAEELEATQEAFKKSVATVRNLVGLVRDLSANLGIDDVGPALDAYKIPTLRGTSTAAVRTGEGGPRPQVARIQISKNGKELKDFTDDKAKLSYAALYMKTDTSAVFTGWTTAANTDKWQDIKSPFTFPVGEYEVTITPKA